MSIKPIDLQTLFVKMAEVSKEQSQIKEHSALQQAQAAKVQVTRELEDEHRVTESLKDEASLTVRDDENQGGSPEKRQSGEGEKKSESGKAERTVLSDPEIGQHIDIKG